MSDNDHHVARVNLFSRSAMGGPSGVLTFGPGLKCYDYQNSVKTLCDDNTISLSDDNTMSDICIIVIVDIGRLLCSDVIDHNLMHQS